MKTTIYLIVETFRTQGKDLIWRTEYSHAVESFTTRDDACDYIYNIYREARKQKGVRFAKFSDTETGAYSEYFFENEIRKLKHKVCHSLQPIELTGEEAPQDV